MAKNTIAPEELGVYVKEALVLYHENVIEKVNEAGEKAIKDLVKKTKATAPKRLGNFRKAITYMEKYKGDSLFLDKEFIWGAKAPHHRLTHLLVNGHAKKGGGRVPGNPFLKNALEQVLPEYEKDVEEALK